MQCNCQFPKNKQDVGILVDVDNLPDCPKTWNLLREGKTLGCWQLESYHGENWTKKLAPENIEHLSALGALLRPGCLNAKDDNGINMTEHYCLRKNKREVVTATYKQLSDILAPTYQVLTYQEQIMMIATEIAGFNLQEADILRKSVGKKKPELMASLEKGFIDGCLKVGKVNKEEAKKIFEWIRASQKYSFNHSHSLGYGIITYQTAYLKAHFPLQFYTIWLKFASDKAKPKFEIAALVKEAIREGIIVHVPDLRHLMSEFYTDGKDIWFGLKNITGIGDSQITNICNLFQQLNDKSWNDILFNFLLRLNVTVSQALILSGALDWLSVSRTQMYFEYKKLKELTIKELQLMYEYDLSLPSYEIINMIIEDNKVNSRRKQILEGVVKLLIHPPISLDDNPDDIRKYETDLLNVSVTYQGLDVRNTKYANTTCEQFRTQRQNKRLCIAGELTRVSIIKSKKGEHIGKPMCFLSIEDKTGKLDNIIVPPEIFSEYESSLTSENIVELIGTKTKNGWFRIHKVCQL